MRCSTSTSSLQQQSLPSGCTRFGGVESHVAVLPAFEYVPGPDVNNEPKEDGMCLQTFSEIMSWVTQIGCASEAVVHFITSEGIESISDLRFFFTSAHTNSCGLARAVIAANRAWQAPVQTYPVLCLPPPAKQTRPPRIKPVHDQGHDERCRHLAAEQAIALSWSWAPDAGLGKNLPADPVVQARRQVSAVQRIAKFEAQGIRAAVVTWQRWTDFCMGIQFSRWKVPT